MTKTDIKNALAIGGIFALRMLGLFMMLPVLSLYAAHLPDANPFLLGVALGIYGLTQALFQLPFGIWSDYTTRRKVIAVGLIIFVFGSLMAAGAHTIWGVIIGRALQGMGAIGSCLIALLGDLVTEEDRTKAMALMGIMIGSSFVIAIILGPLLSNFFTVQELFFLTSIFAVLGLGILFKYVPQPSHTHLEFQLSTLPQQLKKAFLSHALWRLNLSILISHALLTALFVGLPGFLLHQLHLPLTKQWYLYLPALLISLPIVGALLRKSRANAEEYRVIFYCILALLVAEFLFLSAQLKFPSFLLLLGALIIFFTGFTLLEAILPSQVSKVAEANYRGAATGLLSSCQFLGIFLGGILGGILIQKYQYLGNCVGCLLLAIFWFLIMLPYRSQH